MGIDLVNIYIAPCSIKFKPKYKQFIQDLLPTSAIIAGDFNYLAPDYAEHQTY